MKLKKNQLKKNTKNHPSQPKYNQIYDPGHKTEITS